jgi:hypothetical protein
MPKASHDDLCQMFDNTVSMYKNKPYNIIHISRDCTALVRNLLTQRESRIKIDEDNWTAPMQRLGFINIQGSCLYLTRNPIRRYKTGLSKENLNVATLPELPYPRGAMQAMTKVKELDCIELGDCIMGKYPSFEEALQEVQSGVSAMAFDRQFAVDNRGNVFYKTQHVGMVKLNAKSPDAIEFHPAFTHLTTLLMNNYEKILPISGS